MTNKDEANTRQRITMAERWQKAREDCWADECDPRSRMHVSGCQRRAQAKMSGVLVIPEENQLMQAMNDTMKGRTSEIPILVVVSEAEVENWSRWEKGVFEERYTYGGVAEQMPLKEQDRRFEELSTPQTVPARPWWKFWGRRG